MNYLISKFDCVLFSKQAFPIVSNVKYNIVEMCEECGIVISNDRTIPHVLDLNSFNENILKVEFKNDNYYFMFANKYNAFSTTKFNYKSNEVVISLSNKIIITVSGELICEENVDNLSFSHYEFIDDFCLIYFTGLRNYITVLKDKEVCFSGYYDECNVGDKERYFMFRSNDFLNHGRVLQIKNNEYLSYLVYLDDEELNLKDEFVPFVFLDCLKAGNLKYCNQLLSDELKLEDEKDICNFFTEFDYYYPITSTEFILINKNTLAGIFKFDIENNLISNIKSLHQ